MLCQNLQSCKIGIDDTSKDTKIERVSTTGTKIVLCLLPAIYTPILTAKGSSMLPLPEAAARMTVVVLRAAVGRTERTLHEESERRTTSL